MESSKTNKEVPNGNHGLFWWKTFTIIGLMNSLSKNYTAITRWRLSRHSFA